MFYFFFSIALAIISNVFYHLSLKVIPNTANPALSLMVTYATAMLLSLLVFLLFPRNETVIESFKGLNYACVTLGISIFFLELGFILAYRAGWSVSTAGISSNILVSIILIPIGIVLFNENFIPLKVFGIFLGLVSIVLISINNILDR